MGMSGIISDEVYLEEHGIPGTLGRPAGFLDVPRAPRQRERMFWIANPTRTVDLHVGFRARFQVPAAGMFRLAVQSSSVFRVWVDGDLVAQGPFRYVPALLEYHECEIDLAAGHHVIHIEAHDEGIMHRSTAPVPGFVLASLDGADDEVPLVWRARELSHYGQTGVRVSPLLGWMETHTRPEVTPWRLLADDDDGWRSVEPSGFAQSLIEDPSPSIMTLPIWPLRPMPEVAQGHYVDTFAGYDLDDPASQFLLADDQPGPGSPVDGAWFRYDMGHVRIGSVELDIELEHAGTVIIGYAERLTPAGRPSPVIAMSAGPTRMIQQYVVASGRTTIAPLQSLGGRYIEVRVETAGDIAIHRAEFRERDYLGEPIGGFRSDDELLDQIWLTGIRTLRSSTEDAVVDSVRERGEWLGDVISTAHLIMQSGWSDTAPIRRALLHAAAAAREDGLVAGCGPGELIYLGTYAAQWFETCLHVASAEGSDGVLEEFLEAGRANIEAIHASIKTDGTTTLPWGFVDWGYSSRQGSVDVAVLAHAVMAMRSWTRWLDRLGLESERELWQSRLRPITPVLRAAIETSASPYHAYTLGYYAGVAEASEAVPHILNRFENGFPFKPDALRLKNPTRADPTAVTPYFTNYSLPILLEAGLGDTVRELWRAGWGWMLSHGATTWWEVFDDRWSRCHAWSGAPTWQLSRYTLGLHPAPGAGSIPIEVSSLGLTEVFGRVPLREGNIADIEWQRSGDTLTYSIRTTRPIEVMVGTKTLTTSTTPLTVILHRHTGDLFR